MARDVTQASEDQDSTLGRGISIRGQITGEGNLAVEGSVEGEIAISGDLHVADGAEVRAKVEAASAVIDGAVEGDIACAGPVRASAHAVVRGTVRAEAFTMEEGARVSATIEAEFDLPAELAE
ncbi:MAG: polymer-forming cytoskeletal protein [Polyangiaceae bacterium]|jgi:cytoskeletal protein CcmA (bactofilin family)|nr:polymer-forming cytoskeletal protein [Polyangiaceae bacterium]